MARLKAIALRLPTLRAQRVKPAGEAPNPDATPRQRGRPWQRRRDRQLQQQPLCASCARRGITTLAREVDHKVPLHRGGKDDETNMQSLCIPCHKAKTAAERGGYRIPTAAA